MFDFQVPNIEIVEISDDNKYGKFVVEPLERGYGTTLGNSLRRIMLSSLPGAAVSQVKFEGVLHEFSSIPGVKEDVTEIIMNIKSLAIKNDSESDSPVVGYIDKVGDGKAQTFSNWIKELGVNVFIQPIEALFYLIFMSIAAEIASESMVLTMIFLLVFTRAEKTILHIFQVRGMSLHLAHDEKGR